ncbi:MAG TPA: hypothetical protein VG819_13945 [Rhizomicrobium sp.]|jgi:uncharacterized membrane protein HdeD (DUF308 family)|nr:hypothetical protein [Rhizomicrobium sp.]
MLRLVPLLIVPIGLYNLVVVLVGQGLVDAPSIGKMNGVQSVLTQTTSFSLRMFSGEPWTINGGDLIMLLGLTLLFAEIVKATRANSKELVNHGLSMLVFVAALLEFVTVEGFATSTFFFLVLFALFDVVAGYTISAVAAEHHLGLSRAAGD